MTDVCQNLLKIEKLENNGLIEQIFYIGGVIVEMMQHKLNKKELFQGLWRTPKRFDVLGPVEGGRF